MRFQSSSFNNLEPDEVHPRILIFALVHPDLAYPRLEQFASEVVSEGYADLYIAETDEELRKHLTSSSPPTAVYCVDAAIQNPQHRKSSEQLIAFATCGGTVVFGLYFCADFRFDSTYFASWGKAWTVASSTSNGVVLHVLANVKRIILQDLPLSNDHIKGIYLQNVAADEIVYAANLSDPQALVAWAPVGSGFLGYIGTAEFDEFGQKVTMVMLGFDSEQVSEISHESRNVNVIRSQDPAGFLKHVKH